MMDREWPDLPERIMRFVGAVLGIGLFLGMLFAAVKLVKFIWYW